MVVHDGLGCAQRSDPRAGPLDLVLHDATLERVSRDAKEVRSIHDTSGRTECFLTQFALGGGEVEGIENDRHVVTIVGSRCDVKKKIWSGPHFIHVLEIRGETISFVFV